MNNAWMGKVAVLLGGITYISSSGIIAKQISDLDRVANRGTPVVLAILVIEDLGMKRLGPPAAEDLLEVFVRRHEKASTVVTTNRPTQDWGAFLGDIPAATAILDRFLAQADVVQMQGKSYRMQQRAERVARNSTARA
mgnify:CR=1 FL=1